jgi:hypothetical protein
VLTKPFDRVDMDGIGRETDNLGLIIVEGGIEVGIEAHIQDADIMVPGHAGGQVFQGQGFKDGKILTSQGLLGFGGLNQQNFHGSPQIVTSRAIKAQ